MLNRAEIIGHLGRDPEVRTFADGGKVANLSVATSEKWRDKATGETREATEWHRVSVHGAGLVDVLARVLRKGSRVFVSGKLRTRKWQAQDGSDRYSTEIVVAGFGGQVRNLDRKGEGDDAGAGATSGGGRSAPPPPGPGDLDDDIPF